MYLADLFICEYLLVVTSKLKSPQIRNMLVAMQLYVYFDSFIFEIDNKFTLYSLSLSTKKM